MLPRPASAASLPARATLMARTKNRCLAHWRQGRRRHHASRSASSPCKKGWPATTGWSRSCRSSPGSISPRGTTSRSAATKSAKRRSLTKRQQLVSDNHALDGDLVAKCKADLDKIDKNIRPGTLWNVGHDDRKPRRSGTLAKAPRSAPRRHRAHAGRPEGVRRSRTSSTRSIVVNLASTEPPVDEAELPAKWKDLAKLLDKPKKLPAGRQLAVCDRRARPGLSVHQLHAVARLGPRRHSRTGARARHLPHGARRQDGRNAAEERARADVRRPQPAGDELGRPQHLRQPRRQGARRPGQQADQGPQQGPPAAPDPRLLAADARQHRIHRKPRRLENRLGPHPLPRLPRHADDRCSSPGKAAIRCWPRRW